jgi:molybdopterin-synthase adenylyltransferase
MDDNRFARQVALFGSRGQTQLSATRVAVVGAGGIGSHVIQQLALLGVGGLVVIDRDGLKTVNRNRQVGARASDVDETPKVEISRRSALETNPVIDVSVVSDSVVSPNGFAAVRRADWVFGCVDREGVRQILLELCSAYSRPYIDVASEVIASAGRIEYGGRVVVAVPERHGCLSCLGELDRDEVRRDLAGPVGEALRSDLYGVPTDDAGGSGPSVACVNGVMASLAVVEFMVAVTGLRAPNRLLRYRGSNGKVTAVSTPPIDDCFYCVGLRESPEAIDVEQHLREGVGSWLC